MKKLSLAFVAAFAIGTAAPAVAADYIPAAPAPSCHDTYGLFAIFHCWHDGGHPGLFWHH